MQITRKEFLGRLLGGAAGLVGAAMVVGCSSGSSSSSGGGPAPDAATPSDGGSSPDAAHATSCTMNGTNTTIGANHGHVLMVSKADVAAGTTRTYDIRGTSNHPHSVTVTAAMFTMLQGNTAITTVSTTDANHNHPITILCV